MFNRQFVPSVEYPNPIPGLKYWLSADEFNPTAQVGSKQVTDSGITNSISPKEFVNKYNNLSLVMEGFLKADTKGIYEFELASDNGARLMIDNILIIDNSNPFACFEKKSAIPLHKGLHSFKINYFDVPTQLYSLNRSGLLRIMMTPPESKKEELSSD